MERAREGDVYLAPSNNLFIFVMSGSFVINHKGICTSTIQKPLHSWKYIGNIKEHLLDLRELIIEHGRS